MFQDGGKVEAEGQLAEGEGELSGQDGSGRKQRVREDKGGENNDTYVRLRISRQNPFLYML